MNYTATLKRLHARRGIVTLLDAAGEWASAGRVDVKQGSGDSLYEAGYKDAAQRAACRGGRLERFTVEE